MLPRAQARQQNDLAAGEFQGIVMFIGTAEIDLPKARHVLPHLLLGEEPERMIAFDIVFETKLGPGKKTYGNVRLTNRREAAGERVFKLGRDKRFADLRGAVFDVFEAVIANA